MKNFTLIVALIGLANVISSFFGNQETDKIFMIEMNIWYYRLIWGILTVVLFIDYIKRRKSEKKTN